MYVVVRRSSNFNTSRIDRLIKQNKVTKDYGDLSDSSSIHGLVNRITSDEIYNLAAQSYVGVSFNIPEYTADVNALGCLHILDCLLSLDYPVKYYQAPTSEMFGGLPGTAPQN